ncbi:hypothetical protein SDC9_146579 [bioreactor metagenome]|uniref:Uncharacterized protein n=1 Tax=bioreactor metagenome TaxID=1076179 RepID=A0A645EE38_9ZZZZ
MPVGQYDRLIRHFKAQCGQPFFFAAAHLGGGQVAAVAGVNGFAVRCVRGLGGVQLGPAAKAGVHKALCFQPGKALLVQRGAPALPIRPGGAAALIPRQAQKQ